MSLVVYTVGMLNRHKWDGFAMPLVLISSIVMLIVLLGSLTSVTSTSSLMREQLYDKITKEAAESGVNMANACLTLNSNAITWTDAKPLKPNTDCSGNTISTSAYVLDTQNLKTSFKVPAATASGGVQSIKATGVLSQVRTSGLGTPISSSVDLTETRYTSGRKPVIY
jgi:Tfp pilus assembly protein PilX